MSWPIDVVLSRLDGVDRKSEDEAWALCPAHKEKTPSLHVESDREGKVLFHCFGCGAPANRIAESIGLKVEDLFPDGHRRERSSGSYRVKSSKPAGLEDNAVSVEALARHFALPADWLRSEVGLRDSPGSRVEIPVRGQDGEELHVRVRAAMHGKGKYRYKERGATAAPYGLWRLDAARRLNPPSITAVEGESDCWCLWYAGIPALGIPGATLAKCIEAEHLEGISKIYVVQEPDQGGEQFVAGVGKRLREIRWPGTMRVVSTLPGGAKDPADLHRRDPDGFRAKFAAACRRSKESGGPDVGQLLITLDQVERRDVEWLWHPYIPAGELTMLGGKQGEGKGVFVSSLVANLTTGRPLPVDPRNREPARALMFVGEDDYGSVLRPRIEDSGGDLSRVHVYDSTQNEFRLNDEYLARLEALIEHVEPALVVMDPIVSYTGAEVDANRQNEVQAILGPLMRIAAASGSAVLGVMHRRKGHDGGALDQMMASAGWTTAPRSVLYLAEDPDDRDARLLAHAKINVGAPGPTLRYRIEKGILEWDGESPLSADEVARSVRLTADDRMAMDEAVEFIQHQFDVADTSWIEAETLTRESRKLGISGRDLRRAKHALGVRVRSSLGSKLEWALPEDPPGEGRAPV